GPPTVSAIRPRISLWKFLTNNRLMLALRFCGVVRSLGKEVAIGPLRMTNLRDARIQLVGTRKINNETLPVVSLRYARDPQKTHIAHAQLANVQGTIKSLTLNVAVRTPKRLDHKLAILCLDPGDLTLDVDAVT